MAKRQACDAINGFYYQFLHTIKICLDTFLDKSNAIIFCEGKEDIDCIKENSQILIQVKASKNKINISTESFKKSMLNFYVDYLINKEALYVLHTNAIPCGEVVNNRRVNTFEIWDRCLNKNWEDEELNTNLINNLRIILKDYSDNLKKEIDWSNLDIDFLKKVFIEFNSTDSSSYESIIKEEISKRYPKSNENYRTLLFLNLLNFIIKKSTMPYLEERKISYESFTELLNKTEDILENAYKDIILCNEDKTQRVYLNEIIATINKTSEIVEEIGRQTSNLTNNNLIAETVVPQEKIEEYSEYPFVIKLQESLSIPPQIISDAKDKFYQTEYAFKVSEVFSSEQKIGELERIKKAIKNLYILEYWDAQEEKKSSSKLLRSVYDKIIREHNNTLSCSKLRFDYFHKIGLMHHISNEDKEVVWKI